jgi:hypothetical protein
MGDERIGLPVWPAVLVGGAGDQRVRELFVNGRFPSAPTLP